MRPVLADMYLLGGSHAQQDVLEQLFLDSALKAGRMDDVRLMLARVAARHPMPPERRVGYARRRNESCIDATVSAQQLDAMSTLKAAL